MTITIENYNIKISAEIPSDSDFTEVVTMLKSLLYGAGYSMHTINQHIHEEG